MSREDPPWQCPAAGCADGGGSIFLWRIWQTIGNDGAQSQRLWSANALYARSVAWWQTAGNRRTQSQRLRSANALYARSAAWQTIGNNGAQNQRLRHIPVCYARSVTGFFASDFAKEGRIL